MLLVGLICIIQIAPASSQSLTEWKDGLRLTGVNLAGPAFGQETALPGIHGQHYFYPSSSNIDYFFASGMNTIRLCFRWERLQRRVGGELDHDEAQRIDGVVAYATSKGMAVILDVHNFAEFVNSVLGSAALPTSSLADLWGRIAARYRDNPLVIFGLMNEPKNLRTETWLEAANQSIAAIRREKAENLILVPGNGWSAARGWLGGGYGTPNSEVMTRVVDPANNYAYEVHQYFDRDFTGTHPECQNEDIGVATLRGFTDWARKGKRRAFLGEFGVGANPTCLAALEKTLRFMSDNADVWLGWTFWAAGPWGKDYFTSIEPLDGKDRPQMLVLRKYLASPINKTR